tara:strand:- start:5874 stop:7088 length:1215 start_codon:yes stop_codon:yes gene_type:complete
MDNFDYKKYLAEGRLFEEDNSTDYLKLGRTLGTVNNYAFDTDQEYEELGRRYVERGYGGNLQKALDANFGNEPVKSKSSTSGLQPYTDEIRRDEADGLTSDIELDGDAKQIFIDDLMKATEGESWDTFYDIADEIMKKYLAEGRLLREAKDNPKAIILAGAPGAGKGYILKGLDLGGIKVMNIDDIYINLLKQANVSLDLKNATPEERSQQAKQMAVANKEFKGNIAATIEGKESFILDGTAASYNSTVKLKDELEEAGYDVFMLYVYTDLERSLAQNQNRFEKSGGEDRSLAPAIVMRTWKSVTQNLDKYADLFGFNFVAVANTLDDIESISDLESIIKKYLTPFSPKDTIPKSPAQQKRSDDNKAKDAEELKAMLNSDFVYDVIKTSVSKEAAQARLKQFLS